MSQEHFTLWMPMVPQSLNAGGAGSRRHWGAAYREKEKWEETYGLLLMEAGVKRGASFIFVRPTITWHDRRRRDVSNYEAPIHKPFADALVKGGWLADDTSDFICFDGLRFAFDTTLKRPEMTLALTVDYE